MGINNEGNYNLCRTFVCFLKANWLNTRINHQCPSALSLQRIAERNIQPERVQFACGKDVKAEVRNTFEEKGQTVGRIRILRVIESGYEEGLYEGSM